VHGTDAPPPSLARRVRAGVGRRDNWLQLVRFGVVGASGYVVNIAVFAIGYHALSGHHTIAATIAFVVALGNNFVWNRLWTFPAATGPAHHQAARFVTVSLVAFGVSLAILNALIAAGVAAVGAQAIAVLCAMPLNFAGNKLWTFS
jgi:putative flippase GtrA